MKLLAIIDDDASFRRAIQIAIDDDFKDLGLQVYDYGSGSEVILAIQAGQTWDIAIVDLYLQDMSGRQVVRALRNAQPTMLIYVLTGMPITRDVYQDTKSAGADEVVTKGAGDVFRAITDLLSRALRQNGEH